MFAQIWIVATLVVSINLGLVTTASAQILWPCTSQSDDHDGDGFGGEDNSCLVTVESSPPPQITDIETGNSVNLLRAYWLEVDIADKEFACQLYYESQDSRSYMPYDWTLTYRHLNFGSPDEDVFIGRVVEELYDPSTDRTTINTNELWSLDNGYYNGPSPLSESRYVEFLAGENSNTNAVRIWRYGFGDQFWICKTLDRNDFLWPTVFPPTTNITDLYHVECIDSAPVGDGYGWDGYGSCIIDESGDNFRYVTADYVGATPLNATPDNGCDYTDADLYGGWGWNSSTSESCPPLDPNTPPLNGGANSGCDYTDASLHGGWGWNSTTGESCPPVSSTPGNPDNSTDECIDTDGDGWGWDGTASCIVGSDATHHGSCDYSDAALYGGWGWDPVASVSCPPK